MGVEIFNSVPRSAFIQFHKPLFLRLRKRNARLLLAIALRISRFQIGGRMMECRGNSYLNSNEPRRAGCVSRRVMHVAIAASIAMTSAMSAQAANNLVTNGGFEAGNFSGWTEFGDTTFNGVQCPGPGPFVFEGNCSAFFGPLGTTGGISQTLTSLIVGSPYLISFALEPDGGTPSSFSASFGLSNLISLTNPAASPYRLFSFVATATASTQTLTFSFRDDPGFINLDAVRVSLPEPASIALFGAGLLGLLLGRRRRAN